MDKPSVDGEDSAVERAQEAQQDACMKACKGAGLVLINMFALEGFHIAEKMQVLKSKTSCATCTKQAFEKLTILILIGQNDAGTVSVLSL